MRSPLEQVEEELDFAFGDPALNATEEFEKAIAIRGRVTRLMENEDFKWLVAQMQVNLDHSVMASFRAIRSIDEMIASANMSGEIRGYSQAMQFANTLLSVANDSIKRYEPRVVKREEEEGSE
jgi:hypothetical protein